MFSAWKQEKAATALVEAAQEMADKLAGAKPHHRDSAAAHARFWVLSHAALGQDLTTLPDWPAAALKKFVSASQTRINALRKGREYDMADGLAVWLHTARAVTAPAITPPVAQIWALLAEAGPNAPSMGDDLLETAGLPVDDRPWTPAQFRV
jgi:hypothetical protein